MKKVLALVLAVIMVCTMAMAVTIGGTVVVSPSTTPTGVVPCKCSRKIPKNLLN